ncbi:putative ATPase [Nocardia puris]|uniref:Putative ATPase n=2 Tax=Nocardia puris TaxID=208602 RepID=A0A366DN90_9NOCA|nr:putative ATPase [Nocardia puris]
MRFAYDGRGMFPDPGGPNRRTLTLPEDASIVVALLGEVALRRDGVLSAVPGARSRLLLAALALHPGRSRSAIALIEDVWGERPPRSPMNALHTQVSRLRAALPAGALEIGPAGYKLTAPVDLALVADLRHRAERARADGDLPGCLATIEAARRLWRGDPAADLPPGAVADELTALAAARLAELDAVELAARLDAGDHEGALALARRRATHAPLDEPAHHDLLRLLATTGRANEALETFAAFRTRLADELGADPGRALVDLNTAILRGEHAESAAAQNTSAAEYAAGPGAGDAARLDPARSRRTEPPAARSSRMAEDITGVGDATRFDPTHSSAPEFAAASTGLRAAPNALLGRADDLAAITALLSESRVVTVLGPGGTGKTRVANEIGVRVGRGRPVVLVELAAVRGESGDPRSEVEAAIAAVLGLSDLTLDAAAIRGPMALDARTRLREALAARPPLLILDNCEHLIEAVAVVVADLIGAADRLTVLTTSRAPLMITAETVYPLGPLTVDAAGSPATDLFAARARAVRPAVRLDQAAVARLCAALDGLPLAIELAAARVRTMSVAEIEAGLADRFALLRQGDRSSPERHRTLHAVIDWSWDLLDPPQRVALRRLCRFPGGFGLDAARAVAGGPEVGDVDAAVEGLVNQSLLTVLDDESSTRYRMLETVREYGEEGLAAHPDEAERVTERLTCWARELAEHIAANFLHGDQAALAQRAHAEVDNLTTALRYAVDRRDSHTAYSVFPVLAALWAMRGAHTELVHWIEPVFDLGDSPAARSDLVVDAYGLMFMHTLYVSRDARACSRIRLRVRRLSRTRTDLGPGDRLAVSMMLFRGDGAGVARRLAEAVLSDDRDCRVAALLLRANLRENLGDLRGSTRDAMRALALIDEGNLWTAGMLSRHLGQLRGQMADYAGAVTYHRRSLDLLARLGAHEDAVEIRSMLAAALAGLAEWDAARGELALAFEGLDLSPDARSGANGLLGSVTQSMAELAMAEGRTEEGLRVYERALTLCGWPEGVSDLGPHSMMVAAAAIDARVLCERADPADPLPWRLLDVALPALTGYRDLPQIGGIACAIGSFLIAIDRDTDRALELLALAPRVYARQDFPSTRLDRHRALAERRLGTQRVAAAFAREVRGGRDRAASDILRLLEEVAAHRNCR